MNVEIATLVVRVALVYAALGLVFAVPFALRGAARLDPAAREGTWGFRLLLVPGAAALWPLLLLRWVRGADDPEQRTPHTRAARPDR